MSTYKLVTNSQRVETTQMVVSGQMNKKKYGISTKMDYYPAIKRKELLTYATTWVNLENITLSGRSPTQRATYRRIPFTGNVSLGTSMKSENRLMDAEVWGGPGGQ